MNLYDLMTAPLGLCANRDRHDRHPHESATLGTFLCTGDPDDREPGRSQRRLDETIR